MPRIVTTSSRKKKSIATGKILVTATCLALLLTGITVFLNSNDEKCISRESKNIQNQVQAEIVSSEQKRDVESNTNGKVEKLLAQHDATVINEPISTNETSVIQQPVEVVDETPAVRDFNGETEQLLAMMMDADDRHGMPPPPFSSELKLTKDLLIAMTNDIVIYEDDDPKMVALKERVAEAKANLVEIVKNGGSITNAVKEYLDWINDRAAIRVEVVQEYKRLRAEASQEEADNYLNVANEELKAEGITPITIGRSKTKKERNAAKRKQLLEEGIEE